MPKLVCRQCGFATVVSPKMARFGMMCPECQCGNMKPVDDRRRRGGRDVGIRPGAIRTFTGGILFLVFGAAVLFWGLLNWNAGRLGARVVGAGIVLLGLGAVSIFVGGFGILRDLIER